MNTTKYKCTSLPCVFTTYIYTTIVLWILLNMSLLTCLLSGTPSTVTCPKVVVNLSWIYQYYLHIVIIHGYHGYTISTTQTNINVTVNYKWLSETQIAWQQQYEFDNDFEVDNDFEEAR